MYRTIKIGAVQLHIKRRDDLMFIKSRKAKNSKRGIYLQDKQLRNTSFQPGTSYKYIIDVQAKKVVIVPSEDGKNVVSKRIMNDGVKPVIDIRSKEALAVFDGAEFLQVEINDDEIVVSGYVQDDSINDSLVSTVKKKAKKLFSSASKIIDIQDILRVKKLVEVRMSKQELDQVVGAVGSFEQLSIFDYADGGAFSSSSVQNTRQSLKDLKIPLQLISLFSGAGILDVGFQEAGFDVAFALELNESAAETYRQNIGDHIHTGDITEFDKSRFNQIGSPVVIGGSPCQGFSAANRKTNFLDNPNNMLVRHYIDSIKANKNCQVFVLENVPRILTAGDGRFKEEIYEALSEFEITSGVLSAAEFGAAQDRKRAFFIGSKIGKIDLPKPLYTKDNYITVREAFEGITTDLLNQGDYSKGKADTIARMKHVPQGGNWRDIPDELKTGKMKSDKTHSSVYRRLAWDEPAITIANPRKSNITHPEENRILSVRECARLFGLSDSFEFKGTLASMQQQIANSVPVQLGKAIAMEVKKAIQQFNIRNKTESFSLI
ncbi:DNA cytosine methyltransferase [Psychrobacillus sp. FSL H8-0510]|uniref:DNA cytosine methyltransferase n=1 Tax=Psychrobacillus sp. FSL H8-0510 TaxID=2921394 RepID=UPI0030F8B78E